MEFYKLSLRNDIFGRDGELHTPNGIDFRMINQAADICNIDVEKPYLSIEEIDSGLIIITNLISMILTGDTLFSQTKEKIINIDFVAFEKDGELYDIVTKIKIPYDIYGNTSTLSYYSKEKVAQKYVVEEIKKLKSHPDNIKTYINRLKIINKLSEIRAYNYERKKQEETKEYQRLRKITTDFINEKH